MAETEEVSLESHLTERLCAILERVILKGKIDVNLDKHRA